jgi:hypothetical protein
MISYKRKRENSNDDSVPRSKRCNTFNRMTRDELVFLLTEQVREVERTAYHMIQLTLEQNNVTNDVGGFVFEHQFLTAKIEHYNQIIGDIREGRYPEIPYYMYNEKKRSEKGLPMGFDSTNSHQKLVIPQKYRSI